MNLILIFFIKFLASSALLFGFYVLLFKGKASFISRRVFLLSIPILGFILSTTTIQTNTEIAKFSISKLFLNETITNEISGITNFTKENNPNTINESNTIISENSNNNPEIQKGSKIIYGDKPSISINSIIKMIYLVVSIILISYIIKQIVQVKRIQKNAILQKIEGVPVYCSDDISASFSVLKKIYIRADIPLEKQSLVVRHERQHIQCYHYIDLIILEIIIIGMWFNPLLWVIRKELRAVHEFEADSNLLGNGIGIREYMIAILEEATGHTPKLANGLQGSLIKKRFMNMKNGNQIKLRGLRVALTIPFLLIMFGFFSCAQSQKTTKNNPIQIKVENVILEKKYDRNSDLYQVRNSNGEFDILDKNELNQKLADLNSFRIQGLPPIRIIMIDTEGNYLKDVSKEYSLGEKNQEEGINYAHHNVTLASDGSWLNPDGQILSGWTRDYIVRYNAKAITNKRIYIENEKDKYDTHHVIRIEANKHETKITFASTSYWDWCWRFTDKNTCLIDRKTGDRYMIRDIEGDEEVGRLSILEGTNGKWFENTIIFPPLNEEVTMVDYYSPFNNIDAPTEYNGTEKLVPNIVVKEIIGKIIR